MVDTTDPQKLIKDVLEAIEAAMNIETMKNIALFLIMISIPDERKAEVNRAFVEKAHTLGLTTQIHEFLANWKAERPKG